MLSCIKIDHLSWEFDQSNFTTMMPSSMALVQSSSPTEEAAPRQGSTNTMLPQSTMFCSSAGTEQEQPTGQSCIPPVSTVLVDHKRGRSPETQNIKHTILFPTKLRCILDDAVTEGNEHIISWLPDGKAFKIHNPEAFTKIILRRYFRQTMFKSFTRQLYHYGFSKLNDDLDHNTFSHPQFRRDDYESCLTIDRKKHKTPTAPHLHLMTGGHQISLGSSASSPYTSSPATTTTSMPMHEALMRDAEGSPLQPLTLRHIHPGNLSYHQIAHLMSPRKDSLLSEDPRASFSQQQFFDSSRGNNGCLYQYDKERSSMMSDMNKTTLASEDDWLSRLEHEWQLVMRMAEVQQQQSYSSALISDDSSSDALTMIEPRSLEEMTQFPMPISSIMATIYKGL